MIDTRELFKALYFLIEGESKMRDKIINDIMLAMKNKEKEKLSVLRMVKGAIQLEEINKKKNLDDNEVIAVISKQIKTRKESITEFAKGNRQDLITQTEKEIEILNEYMPEQLSETEILSIIDQAIEELKPKAMSDMGKIMKEINPKLLGKADMSLVSKLVKEKLSDIK